jgi:hypothetical protein
VPDRIVDGVLFAHTDRSSRSILQIDASRKPRIDRPYLRRKGIHQAHLDAWRARLAAGLQGGASKSKGQRSADARRVQELEKEIRRKDKALAEAAALLLLQKKVREIWGDGDASTPPRSES